MVHKRIVDWDASMRSERKLLSKPVGILKRRLNISWQEVFIQAFGVRDTVGLGYEDNLYKGKIAPEKAHKLFVWLLKNDPALASQLEDDILANRVTLGTEAAKNWEQMVNGGKFSNINLYRFQDGLGMASFARREPIHDLRLNIQEEFYFEFDCPFDGYLVAFQKHRSHWFPQPLSEDHASIKLSKGKQLLPAAKDGQPDPLWEDADKGKHGYLFLISISNEIGQMCEPFISVPDQPIPTKTLDDIAKATSALGEGVWDVFRINVLFK